MIQNILLTKRVAIIGLLLACGNATLNASTPVPPRGGNTVFSVVENPDVPLSMEFAGQKINLDRIDMFERLDRELTSMTYTHGNTLLMLKRANRYFPELAPILKRNGIPHDMLYLACIESTLNPRAYSAAKAAGLWQFMPETGKQYGLEVNEWVDERYNTEKATEAACRYLKTAYQKYGNWESVAASYNGGMGRVSTELSKQLASSAFDLYLVDETSRYMFRILAAKLIMENPAAYGFRLDRHQMYQPIEYDVVEVNGPVEDWPTWAKDKGITYYQLREMNPWIRAKSLPNKTGKTYQVKIPKADSLYRSKQKKTIYNKNWVVQ